jgi:two-component system alkaline phosphatase synthesis response regulator PhoP
MKKILLVEDDPQIADLLNLYLHSSQYTVTSCDKGKDAVARISGADVDYNLIILDIMLPDVNGIQVCKEIRDQHCTTPIMMLSSISEESDKVLALELGADDYVTKPFGIFEFMARTKALLRRDDQNKRTGPGQAGSGDPEKVIICRDLRIDTNKKKVTLRGKRLDLTGKEFELLSLMASQPGRSFSRSELLELIWGFTFQGYEHTVTAHINRLRIKIEKDLNRPEYILTSWGVGYRFTE